VIDIKITILTSIFLIPLARTGAIFIHTSSVIIALGVMIVVKCGGEPCFEHSEEKVNQ
jgi:hypothetical protein